MFKDLSTYSKEPAKALVLLGIPILFIIGSLMHFAYEWSGRLTIVGIFVPVNESIWEHLKMTFWPILVWWLISYLFYSKNSNISASKWIISCTISELACPLVITSFYYTYTGALAIESLALDIFSLFLGILLAQILAFHVYKYSKPNYYCLNTSIAILVFLAIAFTVFTFFPPHIPLFMDHTTGIYGL